MKTDKEIIEELDKTIKNWKLCIAIKEPSAMDYEMLKKSLLSLIKKLTREGAIECVEIDMDEFKKGNLAIKLKE